MNEDILRRRSDDDDAERKRLRAAEPDPGAWSGVCKTTTVGTYPTTAQAYYMVVPCDVGGTETEGSAVILTANKGPFLAVNLGSLVPPSGTAVIVTCVGGRKVFRYGT